MDPRVLCILLCLIFPNLLRYRGNVEKTFRFGQGFILQIKFSFLHLLLIPVGPTHWAHGP